MTRARRWTSAATNSAWADERVRSASLSERPASAENSSRRFRPRSSAPSESPRASRRKMSFSAAYCCFSVSPSGAPAVVRGAADANKARTPTKNRPSTRDSTKMEGRRDSKARSLLAAAANRIRGPRRGTALRSRGYESEGERRGRNVAAPLLGQYHKSGAPGAAARARCASGWGGLEVVGAAAPPTSRRRSSCRRR